MSFSNASFGQVLDDLCSRFIINVPLEELSSIERIYFQIEQALWFYDDFVREQRPGIFRKFQLNQFSLVIMNRCPLLHPYLATHDETYRQFINYKTQVPSCGAVIINKQLTKCVLVKGYQQGAGWGFPRGKINKDEPMEECAIRETFEETGFDVTRYLLPTEYLDRTMHGRPVRLYIAAGVDEKTAKFEIITRKEISDIQWFPLDQLPDSRGGDGFDFEAMPLMKQWGKTVGKRTDEYVRPWVAGVRKWVSERGAAFRAGRIAKYDAAAAALGSLSVTPSTSFADKMLGVDSNGNTVADSDEASAEDETAQKKAQLLALLKPTKAKNLVKETAAQVERRGEIDYNELEPHRPPPSGFRFDIPAIMAAYDNNA